MPTGRFHWSLWNTEGIAPKRWLSKMGITQQKSSCLNGFQLWHNLQHLLLQRNLLPVVHLRERCLSFQDWSIHNILTLGWKLNCSLQGCPLMVSLPPYGHIVYASRGGPTCCLRALSCRIPPLLLYFEDELKCQWRYQSLESARPFSCEARRHHSCRHPPDSQ